MPQTPYIYYYTACLALILTGVISAAVRWFHMCRPYDTNGDYYYPVRRYVTFFALAHVLLVPYLFHLQSPDAWLFVRVFGVIYYPLAAILLLHNYLPSVTNVCRRRTIDAIIATPPLLVLVVLSGIACRGGEMLVPYATAIVWTCSAIGIVLLLVVVYMVHTLRLMLKHYNEETYSNEDDFPKQFGSSLMILPIIALPFVWLVLITDSPMVKMIVDLVVSVDIVYILCVILHPHTPLLIEEPTIEDENVAPVTPAGAPYVALTDEDYLARMERYFVAEKAFLNPNLTIMDVALYIGRSRTQTSQMMTKRHGSFVIYVNTLRIEYAMQLRAAHPHLKQMELYQKSGFNNRNSYIKWLAHYEENQKYL